nr:hypothetical protein [Tanacetum cinerariifolium]
MFMVDRIEVKGTMQGVHVLLVMEGLKTELGMQIQVKQGKLSATTAMENKVALDKEQLLFIAGGQDTVVDEDVDEQPTMFMENLSSLDPVYDKASLSYASGILSEVHDHDNYQDVVCEHHEVHEMHDDVQQNFDVESDASYTSDSNMISYDQYVKDNVESVVHSNVPSVLNDAYMMIINEMHEQTAQCVYVNNQNKVVNASLTVKLARYKKQVELHERRAKFELNEREQMIEEQLRIIITGRNIKEENLKKELHSVKMQLNSTINPNKSMVEEVPSLKTDFQQKENKYLEEFLDMKALKKVEDRLFKQDQSVQTVHMLCKPKSFYDESNWVAICYMNPFYLSKAKQVQPALYNGHEIVKPNHDRALVHDSEDTLEIAETTRKQMLEKMNDLECVKKKIFWSNDLIKIHAKALSAKAKSANPNRALTVYHPSIPAKLVPKVLPTRSQVQVNIYSLVQLFLKFDKTCKKRITPTGLTEWERGFEQTKTCYLPEVIPLFKTIKEHYEGIQTALVKEIKEMKEVFEQMEVEMDQHAIDKKYTMADMNIPANDVPTKPAPAIAPPTRTNDQILPLCKWVPVGKINYMLDRLKSQRNQIFKLDEQWFNLHKDILRDALQITSINDNNLFVAPPSSGAVIEYVNTLGYPCTLRNVSAMSVNDLYQPWRAILSMINMCLMEEEAVPESPALKATKVTKSKTAMQTKPSAPKVTKHIGDKAPKPTSSQPPKPTPTPTKSSKEVQGKKYKLVKETSNAPSATKQSKASNVAKKRKSKSPLKLVDEFVDEGVPVKEPVYNDEEANFQRTMELSIKKKNPADQFIFYMRTPMTTGPSRNIKSPFLDAKLALADSEIDSDVPDISMAKDTEMEVTYTVTPIHEEFTSLMYPNVQDNRKLPVEEQVILEEPTSSTGTLSSLHHLDKDFNFSDQFLNDKSSDVEKEKTHAEAEVESLATITIQQDTSFVPPMTFKVVDLPKPRPDDPNVHSPLSSTTLAATLITRGVIEPSRVLPSSSSARTVILELETRLELDQASKFKLELVSITKT